MSSLTRTSKRLRAFGEMRRSLPSFEMQKPRNAHSSRRATALLDSFTFKRRFEVRKILEEIRREFPGDEMMQQIHFSKQIHYYETKELSPEEKIRYFGGNPRKKV